MVQSLFTCCTISLDKLTFLAKPKIYKRLSYLAQKLLLTFDSFYFSQTHQNFQLKSDLWLWGLQKNQLRCSIGRDHQMTFKYAINLSISRRALVFQLVYIYSTHNEELELIQVARHCRHVQHRTTSQAWQINLA